MTERETNPFLAVALSAAYNKSVILSNKQCRKLMRDAHFYSKAVNVIPLDQWDVIMGTKTEIKTLAGFKKFGNLE